MRARRLVTGLLFVLGAGAVSALNVFVRGGDGWRLVAHHVSPVVT